MHRLSKLWKANIIVFISSFCVMVIELIAGRLLAPYIGVSLYTWTSIIGVILAGIALGNYLGGKIADRYPSPLMLVGVFFIGGLLTIAILPVTKLVASTNLFGNLPIMLDFTLKIAFIFFLPAIILSTVTPLVIKLTLADLGRTGGIVGTIYAVSTAGSILGTFLTGFLFILWFGIRTIVWLVAAVLILTGILAFFSWKIPDRWKPSLKNFTIWTIAIEVALISVFSFQFRESWQESYTKESNYYSIKVWNTGENVKALRLDYLIHSLIVPDEPLVLLYPYLNVFTEVTAYLARENPAPRVLHLGGGGYSFPRFLEIVYPGSVNDVVEIDPAVTQVVYEELGLPKNTSIKTYNQDARLFLTRRKAEVKYDIAVGDVFSDRSTPYHLTTLEFDKLVKANLKENGVYLVNIVDSYQYGRYMPSVIYTLKQTFNYVYLLSTKGWEDAQARTYVIIATDRQLDLADYQKFVTHDGKRKPAGALHDEVALDKYLVERKAILLTDNYAPTDILVTPLFR